MSRGRSWVTATVAAAAIAAPLRGGEPIARAPTGAAAHDPPAREIDRVAMPPSAAERLERIRQRVQAAVVYPRAARERGLRGVARIQFRIAPDGRAAEVITVESSGYALLDGAAEQAARDARELPQLYGWIRIPVRFELTAR